MLAIDVGNTNITIGLFRNQELLGDWRLSTDQHKTRDELGLKIKSLLDSADFPYGSIEGIAVSSVVPYLNRALQEGLIKYLSSRPRFLRAEDNQLVEILLNEPQSLGADRVANCIAASRKHEGAILIIDFGTATSFDLVSPKAQFLGGAIAPEMEIAMEALYERAALLPEIELQMPAGVVGKTTEASMKSGFVFGFISLIEGMISRFKREHGEPLTVLATGGKGQLFAEQLESIDHYEDYLVLEGLRIWWNQLQKG
ncbi:MAG: type III pantothenate kinase [Candidatus Acetothermia bacterium]